MAPARRLPPGAKARAAEVVERLAREYDEAHTELTHVDPFQLLVAVILSAQTTDERVNLVTPTLFARFPTPEAMAAVAQEELEALIRPTGFFRSKARALREMSQDVVVRFGGAVPQQMEELVLLRGVGRKTANVVLGVAFGEAGFPVDTHVKRLTHRLRLTYQTDPVKIEQDVCRIVPREEWTDLSLRLILHGRRVCQARQPRCGACVLADICPSAYLGDGAKPARRTAKTRRR
ncbi:MAG: endonuclease III [Candidatus Dormibacteraeota bacterium]|nr:endonuclease III [Candidatus Dormibacteraeota bacterium]